MEEKYSIIHRPQTFNDICGNIEVVNLLKEKSRINKLDKMTIVHGHSGVGKSTIIYILAKAFLCTGRTFDGNPCCKCESCIEIQNTLYLNGKVNRGSGVEIFDMGKDGDEFGYINKIVQRVNASFTSGRRVLILEEMHNTSVKNQQKLNTSLEYIPDDILILIPTSDYYSKISTHLKTRSSNYLLTNPGRDTIVNYLYNIANNIVEETGGTRPTKTDLRKLVTLKNSNMRECVDALSLLIDCGSIGRDFIMGDFNKRLDQFIEYLRAIKMGIIQLTEFVNELPDRALFLQNLPKLLEQGISLRSVANDMIEPSKRKEINDLMRNMTEIRTAQLIRSIPNAYNMREEDARTYLWCIGIELNSTMSTQMNLSDEENSVDLANDEGGSGVDLIALLQRDPSLEDNGGMPQPQVMPFGSSENKEGQERDKGDYAPGNTILGEFNVEDL